MVLILLVVRSSAKGDLKSVCLVIRRSWVRIPVAWILNFFPTDLFLTLSVNKKTKTTLVMSHLQASRKRLFHTKQLLPRIHIFHVCLACIVVPNLKPGMQNRLWLCYTHTNVDSNKLMIYLVSLISEIMPTAPNFKRTRLFMERPFAKIETHFANERFQLHDHDDPLCATVDLFLKLENCFSQQRTVAATSWLRFLILEISTSQTENEQEPGA